MTWTTPAQADEPEPDRFYLERRKDLLLYACGMAINDADAEDAVAKAVEESWKYYRAHGRFCPTGKDPVGWMKVIIRNYLRDIYRHRQVEERHRPKLNYPGSGDVADQAVDSVMAEQVFSELARSLRPQDHDIFSLHLQDHSNQDIALRLKLPEGTIRSSISRSKNRLRHIYGTDPP